MAPLPKKFERRLAKAFKDLAKTLEEANAAGHDLRLYMANDSLHVMHGGSHDENMRPQFDRILLTQHFPGAGGGDW